MAGISAFRAHRYDLGHVGALSDVVSPPYDVIDAALQQSLYDRSAHNVIRLELNQPQPDDSETSNRYTRAAGFLREWQADGVIKQDTARSLYVLHQEYEVEGQRYIRRGFFARVRLEPFGQGDIFPHEETMSGPKADRLNLLRATQMNLSPVFGLYPDEQNEVQNLLDAAVGRALPLEAADHLGVVSRLWPVTDQQVISQVIGLMGPRPIFIADGHHRYETCLRYLQERRDAGDIAHADAPANYVLMNLVGMSDPGLLIQPTHRLITGLVGVTAEQIAADLGSHFALETMGVGEAAAAETWERIQMDGSQRMLGFGTIADGKWQLARLKSPEAMQPLACEHSDEWRGLAVAVLHVLVLGTLIKGGADDPPRCRYVHLLNEVNEAARQRTCNLAVLVPPATMGHVERISRNLEKMPPKSTYFYPKILSGLVFHSLRGN